jgi:hypothetical protein
VSRSTASAGARKAMIEASPVRGNRERQNALAGRTATQLAAPASVSNQALGQALGAGTALPPTVRSEMEVRFGQSFADVRIHDDAPAHRNAADFDAKAYTHGTDVAFGAGWYAPEAPEGKRLLAHELAHVVQQRRGGARPALDPHGRHEVAADRAADAVAAGAGPVTVAGATGVGVAREPDPEKKKKKDDAGPVRRVGPKAPDVKRAPPPVTIKDPKKAGGVLGEVAVPFEHYSDPSWNNLGGGEETSTSRLSQARKTSWGKTGGLDFLVENRRTGRLVIGEQKRLGTASFSKATATTTNLEKNIANTIKQLRKGISKGRVHRDEVAHVRDVIERLSQTGKALAKSNLPVSKSGTKPGEFSLPEEVVFELTASGGKSTKIGKDYVTKLAEKYKPEVVQKLLERTYVRHSQPVKGRDPSGAIGTNADPHIVPARDAMTPEAKSELERLLAGKTPKEWTEQKLKEKQAQAKERQRAKKADKEAVKAKRAAERERLNAEAKKVAQETREKKLQELREAAKAGTGPEPASKAEKRLADNKLKTQATEAAKEAKKKFLEEARQRAKAQSRQKAAPDPVKAQAPAAKTTAPKELPPAKVAPEASVPAVKTLEPAPPLEFGPKGVTPKGVAKGAVGVAGVFAGVSGVNDIVNEVKAKHYWTALGKTGLLGASFYAPAAPPLFAFGAIMNYWGPRHDKIQEDSFEAGDAAAEGARHIPLLGRSETFRDVMGGLAAAETAVEESIAYTVKDMGSAVVEGAEIVGGLAEDAYDFLSEGPSIFDMVEEIRRRGKD